MHTWSHNTYKGTHLKRDPITKHRLNFKFQIKYRTRMSPSGYLRWGRWKRYISKSPYVWRFYSSSKEFNPDGVPIKYLVDNKTFIEFMIYTFYLADGEQYAIHGFTRRKGCRHGCGLTKKLLEFVILDSERLKYRVISSKGLDKYFFRRQEKKRRKEMLEG